jgi:hypothetical protein
MFIKVVLVFDLHTSFIHFFHLFPIISHMPLNNLLNPPDKTPLSLPRNNLQRILNSICLSRQLP